MSKKDKELKKLLQQKTLSSKEAVRLLELDGWIEDKDKQRKQSGSSHQQFIHPIKKGKNYCTGRTQNPPGRNEKEHSHSSGTMGEITPP